MRVYAAPAERGELARELSIQCAPLAVADYLELYRAVGAPWGWDQRLCMPPRLLANYLASENCNLYLLSWGATVIGFCEFDRRLWPSVELMNFGLRPTHFGHGWGDLLLRHALCKIFAAGASDVCLHTDEWDHPRALALYLECGFILEETRLKDPAGL